LAYRIPTDVRYRAEGYGMLFYHPEISQTVYQDYCGSRTKLAMDVIER
jgi:hypothetical protein